MKHGDKAKATASKASGKKTSAAGGTSSKAVKNLKASKQRGSSAKADTKKSTAAAKATGGGNGTPKGRPPEGIHFTNATVAAAFKRAVKKFPNAFRRLTD